MIQKLSKHGDGFALVLDQSMLDSLRIDDTTPLEVSTNGQALVISPVRDATRQAQFEAALAETNRRYGKALQRLAE